MQQWIKAVGTGKKGSRDLTHDEAQATAHAIARGEATDAQVAAFLMAARMKGETDDEIFAFVEAFRKYLLPFRSYPESINCAGPYDGRNYFPLTIPVSLLLASVGVPHLLHGSDSLPPKRGTCLKELLSGLNVEVNMPVKQWEMVFSRIHIGFIWTEKICPPFRHLRKVREEIGLRTMINTVEKVMNPIQSKSIIIGVNHRTAMSHLVEILPRAGFETSYIVQGIEGAEELPVHKKSAICKVTPFGDESTVLDPATFGFAGEPLPKFSKEEQLALLKALLTGKKADNALRPIIEHVIFNAGLRLYWFDKVSSYEEGFQLAESLLKRGEASRVLWEWVEMGRSPAGEGRKAE